MQLPVLCALREDGGTGSEDTITLIAYASVEIIMHGMHFSC